LLLHLGFDLWGCASCSFVNELPVSSALAWAGPFVTGALAVATFAEVKWASYALGLVAVASAAQVGWMVTHQQICLICILVHVGLISAALTLVPRANWLGAIFFAVSIVFVGTEGLDRFATPHGIAIFSPRAKEVVPPDPVYVLFTDPECSRCKLVEESIEKLPSKPAILHRWTLLPQNRYRTIRVAAMLEMAKLRGAAEFEKLRLALLKRQPPYTDATIEEAGAEAGLGAEVKGWLDFPADTVLIDLQRDETTSLELKIESLPALAELLPPDKSGTRMMRLVPLQTIGVRP